MNVSLSLLRYDRRGRSESILPGTRGNWFLFPSFLFFSRAVTLEEIFDTRQRSSLTYVWFDEKVTRISTTSTETYEGF